MENENNPGSRAWHEQQLIKCLGDADHHYKLANGNKDEVQALLSLQLTVRAVAHALLMLNPDLVNEEYAEEEKDNTQASQ